MAKKENKYLKDDMDRMLKLFKHAGPLYQEQQDLIWEMLKKYIEPNHPRPILNCNCSLSFGSCFSKLRDWAMANANKFEN